MKMKLITTTLGILSIAGFASAATITWTNKTAAVEGTNGEILSSGLFSTWGRSVTAVNGYGGKPMNFDGIAFDGYDVNDTRIDIFAPPVSSWYDFHTGEQLSRHGLYDEGNTVSLNDLSIGKTYLVEVLIYDGRTGTYGRTVSFDGGTEVQFANGTADNWGPGVLFSGTFTADASTQNFTIDVFNAGSDTSLGGQLNAISVRVPEPSSIGLLIAGIGLFGVRRTSAKKLI